MFPGSHMYKIYQSVWEIVCSFMEHLKAPAILEWWHQKCYRNHQKLMTDDMTNCQGLPSHLHPSAYDRQWCSCSTRHPFLCSGRWGSCWCILCLQAIKHANKHIGLQHLRFYTSNQKKKSKRTFQKPCRLVLSCLVFLAKSRARGGKSSDLPVWRRRP